MPPSSRLRGVLAARPVMLFRRHLTLIWMFSLPIFLAVAVSQEWQTLSSGVGALKTAGRGWIIGGVALQLTLLLGPPISFRIILRRLGYRISTPALIGMHFQRITIGTLAPLGGPAAAVTFVRALDARRVATADALTLLAMRSISTQAAFISMSIVVIALRDITAGLIAASIVALAIAIIWAIRRRDRAFAWEARGSRLPSAIAARIDESIDRFRRHQLRAADLVQPTGIALLNRIGGLVLLAFAVEALGANATPQMIALVALAEVLAKLTVPLFHGLGAIEVATAIALERSGVPAATAIGAAILWRIFECWLPLAVALLVQGGGLICRRFELGERLPIPARWSGARLAPAPVPVPVPIALPVSIHEHHIP